MSYTDCNGVEIKAGYRMWNGHIMSQSEADNYNSFTQAIEKAEANGWKKDAEFYRDQRHKFTLTLN